MWLLLLAFSIFVLLVLVLPCVHLVLKLANKFLSLPNLDEKPVLVTGCDTGFGRLLTLKLLQNGMQVFAGCLTEKGETSLKKEAENLGGSLICFPLDVTSDESVQKAAELVSGKLQGKGLWGLVNNAGIIGPTAEDSFLRLSHYREVMEVNVFGVVRMCHAFKTLVKKSQGRIVNMSSCAGRFAGPGIAPYFASKYALEAYSDSIRYELVNFNVSVHLLEPEFFKTQLATPDSLKGKLDDLWNQASEQTRAEFGEKFHEISTYAVIKCLLPQ